MRKCPKCGGSGKIMTKHYQGMLYNIWAECEQCEYRTGSFRSGPEPAEKESAAKFAIILWEWAQPPAGEDKRTRDRQE